MIILCLFEFRMSGLSCQRSKVTLFICKFFINDHNKVLDFDSVSVIRSLCISFFSIFICSRYVNAWLNFRPKIENLLECTGWSSEQTRADRPTFQSVNLKGSWALHCVYFFHSIMNSVFFFSMFHSFTWQMKYAVLGFYFILYVVCCAQQFDWPKRNN